MNNMVTSFMLFAVRFISGICLCLFLILVAVFLVFTAIYSPIDGNVALDFSIPAVSSIGGVALFGIIYVLSTNGLSVTYEEVCDE